MSDCEQRILYAKAVALVWAFHAVNDSPYAQVDFRVIAHPLGCVREALDGETRPEQLGCRPDDLSDALAALAQEALTQNEECAWDLYLHARKAR